MSEDKLITITEVCYITDTSIQTINNWYKWKRLNPDNIYAKFLPDYIQDGARQKRYWKLSEVDKLVAFKHIVVKGRNGFLGEVTQKYYHNKKEN